MVRVPSLLAASAQVIVRVVQNVGHMNDIAFQRRSPGDRATIGLEL